MAFSRSVADEAEDAVPFKVGNKSEGLFGLAVMSTEAVCEREGNEDEVNEGESEDDKVAGTG